MVEACPQEVPGYPEAVRISLSGKTGPSGGWGMNSVIQVLSLPFTVVLLPYSGALRQKMPHGASISRGVRLQGNRKLRGKQHIG